MGLGCDAIDLVIRLKTGGYFPGKLSVIEIGAQQLANTFLEARADLDRVGALFQVPSKCPLPQPLPTHIIHGSLEHQPVGAPPARDFWTWLGFDYAAIDIDESPGSIPLDLNYDPIPAEASGAYGLVTNFGTTEHVANQLNAFRVIHDLTALGGVMIHHLPMQGMVNHGLVNYNPKFFWMLARSNGYSVIYMNVVGDPTYYSLPENVTDAIRPFEPDIDERQSGYRVADTLLVVMLQKVFQTPYVAPLDVPTGTSTANEVLANRYWSVFKPNAFDNFAAGDTEAVPTTQVAGQLSPDALVGNAERSSAQSSPPAVGHGVQRAVDITKRVFGNADSVSNSLHRVEENLDALIAGYANQTDLLARKLDEVSLGISQKSDLLNRQLNNAIEKFKRSKTPRGRST